MSWQDYVFSLGSLVFTIALLPSVRSSDKPHIKTSIITAVVLTIFAGAYFSMHFYWSATVTFANAIIWYILFLQKYVQHTKKQSDKK
ncbi:hypothetical protein A3F37_02015 [Candidatus Saccharibacteria bacterium RIFCSPHIGHO2_12_FULL_41_12]|nr:MAG: hypothetical protein A3F37_02015 [Candidatus Saccharibacteria bacterium RIFCSPHIGHO2_12_FULL_41_12]